MRLLLSKCVTFYQNCLKNYPIATQAVQVSLLMGGGDIIAQNQVEKIPLNSLNIRRTAEFTSIGFFLVGPGLRFWYGKLDKLIPETKIRWHRTLKKTCLDQLVFAPIFIAVFAAIISVLQGMNVEQVINRVKCNYFSIVTMNYTIWPLAQLINFGLVPLNYQVLFTQFIAIIWNTYLSVKLGKKNGDKQVKNI